MSDDDVQSTLAHMGFFGMDPCDEHGESPGPTPSPPCVTRVLKPVVGFSAAACVRRNGGDQPCRARIADALRRGLGAPPWFVCASVLAGLASLCAAFLLAPTSPAPVQDYVNRKGALRFQLAQLVAARPLTGDRVRVLVAGGSAHFFLDELRTLGSIVGSITGNGTGIDILFSGFTAGRAGMGVQISTTLDAMASRDGDWADINTSVWMAHRSICDQFLRVQEGLSAAVADVDALASAVGNELLTVFVQDPVLDSAICSLTSHGNERLRVAGLAVQRYFALGNNRLHLHGDGAWDLIAVMHDMKGVAIASAVRSAAGVLDAGGRVCFIDTSMRRSSRAEWEKAGCLFGIPLYSMIPMGVRRDSLDKDWRSAASRKSQVKPNHVYSRRGQGLYLLTDSPQCTPRRGLPRLYLSVATHPPPLAGACGAVRPSGAMRARPSASTGPSSVYLQ